MRHTLRTVFPVVLALSVLLGSRLTPVEAQTPGASLRLEQAQARVTQLSTDRQELQGKRRRLLREQARLVRLQAQLQKEIPLTQKELKESKLPDQELRLKCRLLDLNRDYEQVRGRMKRNRRELAKTERQLAQNQLQLAQALRELSQAQQQVTEQLRTRTPPGRRGIDRVMNEPEDPLADAPPFVGPVSRQLVLVGIKFTSANGTLTANIPGNRFTLTVTAGATGTYAFTVTYIFRMSDNSIQTVRGGISVDSNPGVIQSTNWGVGGRTARALMNAPVADTTTMFGGHRLDVNYTPGDIKQATGRVILDVPGDSSVAPLIISFTIVSQL